MSRQIENVTGTWTLDAALDANGDFIITDGTFDTSVSSYAVNVAGDWTNNDTFTAQSGTVTLDGNVTDLKINPSGIFSASDGVNHPSFSLKFKVGVQ